MNDNSFQVALFITVLMFFTQYNLKAQRSCAFSEFPSCPKARCLCKTVSKIPPLIAVFTVSYIMYNVVKQLCSSSENVYIMLSKTILINQLHTFTVFFGQVIA